MGRGPRKLRFIIAGESAERLANSIFLGLSRKCRASNNQKPLTILSTARAWERGRNAEKETWCADYNSFQLARQRGQLKVEKRGAKGLLGGKRQPEDPGLGGDGKRVKSTGWTTRVGQNRITESRFRPMQEGRIIRFASGLNDTSVRRTGDAKRHRTHALNLMQGGGWNTKSRHQSKGQKNGPPKKRKNTTSGSSSIREVLCARRPVAKEVGRDRTASLTGGGKE